MLRYLTAGESHGSAEVAILEGCPANLPLKDSDINSELARRQEGYGRGARMAIEKDKVKILSGIRKGKTMGSPIALLIPNKSTNFFNIPFTQVRPGHADLAGAQKYNQKDVRTILERASARETAAKVAIGAIAKRLLAEFKIKVESKVLAIGGETRPDQWKALVDYARDDGDTLGGLLEVIVSGAPAGLGTHVHWDRRLDGLLAQAVMAIPAIKSVEIGLGKEVASLPGSRVHDEIFYSKAKGFYRKTNNAGGLEGGMTNGEPIVVRAAMKPIATLRKPLATVDYATKKETTAFVERSDVCAVEPAAVIGEAVVAIEIANALLEKFGGDVLEDTLKSYKSYVSRI